MTQQFFNVGERIRITATFTNSVGTAVAPSVVKFKYKNDFVNLTTTYTSGTDAALVSAGTGIFYVDILTDVDGAGHYTWRFYSTSAGNQAATEDVFYVRQTAT